MFDMQSVGDLVSDERPRRARDREPNEMERARRFADGQCRDCNRRRRPTGALCGHCRKRIERNTVRDAAKQPRKGPPGKWAEIDKDLGLALREVTEAKAQLAELAALPRSVGRTQAIKDAKAKLALGARFVDHVLIDRLGGAEE